MEQTREVEWEKEKAINDGVVGCARKVKVNSEGGGKSAEG